MEDIDARTPVSPSPGPHHSLLPWQGCDVRRMLVDAAKAPVATFHGDLFFGNMELVLARCNGTRLDHDLAAALRMLVEHCWKQWPNPLRDAVRREAPESPLVLAERALKRWEGRP